jgi:hypothetical protein
LRERVFDENFTGRRNWPDGRLYEGDFDFENGQFDGNGRYEWPNGSVYEGGFVDGEMTGKGTLTMPNGRTLEGEFGRVKILGNVASAQPETSNIQDRLDNACAHHSEPAPRQEPKPEPRQEKPVLNEIENGKRTEEVLTETDAPQWREAERASIAADERLRAQESAGQERLRKEYDAGIRQRRQEISDRYDALLKDRFPFAVGGAAWLWFMVILYPVWALGEVLFQTRGEFLGPAFFLSLGITPLMIWRVREKRRKSRKYVAIIAKRDAELRKVS